jgi:uncharacterized protein YqfA (UPF0365 family)
LLLLVFFSFLNLWLQALLTGARVGCLDLVAMKFKVDYAMLVRQKIALVQAGVKVGTNDLEAHYLARGNVPKVATAVIAAHKAGIELSWRIAAGCQPPGRPGQCRPPRRSGPRREDPRRSGRSGTGDARPGRRESRQGRRSG